MQVLRFLIDCHVPFAICFGLTFWLVFKIHEWRERRKQRAEGVHYNLTRAP